jgi:hypothetical protein
LVGTRICADLRWLAVTSRLFSFAMARFLARHLDRAGRGRVFHAASMTIARVGPATCAPILRCAASFVVSWFVMYCFIESYHVI